MNVTSLRAAAIGAAFSCSVLSYPLPAQAQTAVAPIAPAMTGACPVGGVSTKLSEPLPRLAAHIAQGQPVTIVAIGSSSTAGAGASSPEHSYPARLEAELRARYPGVDIRVINRGVNGQDAPEMLARFDTDVAALKPTVVIWQAGVNAILTNNGLGKAGDLAHEAIRRIEAINADVLLIDQQYSPRVIADPDADGMVALTSAVGEQEDVPVYHRYAMMRDWHERGQMPFTRFLAADQFHMNDWSYNCFAKDLAGAIATATGERAATLPVAPGAASIATISTTAKPAAKPAGTVIAAP